MDGVLLGITVEGIDDGSADGFSLLYVQTGGGSDCDERDERRG